MHRSKINKYSFEHDPETNRIMIYKEGSGTEPIAFIGTEKNLSEKDFHYDIMEWFSKATEG